jgi:hypothetical protein
MSPPISRPNHGLPLPHHLARYVQPRLSLAPCYGSPKGNANPPTGQGPTLDEGGKGAAAGLTVAGNAHPPASTAAWPNFGGIHAGQSDSLSVKASERVAIMRHSCHRAEEEGGGEHHGVGSGNGFHWVGWIDGPPSSLTSQQMPSVQQSGGS